MAKAAVWTKAQSLVLFIFALLKIVKCDRQRDVTQGQTDVKVEIIM